MALKKPKAPPKTAEQQAVEKRNQTLLDQEIKKQEDLLKRLARGKLGRASLLSGAPKTVAQASAGSPGGGSGGGSLLSGPSTSSPGIPTASGFRGVGSGGFTP